MAQSSDNLTVSDKLLLAAYELDEGQGKHFSAEDLVVSAWRKFPNTFGLRGYNDQEGRPMYPDSNRVFAEIMGSKPIRKRGHLVKRGEKVYGLTPSGQDRARMLAQISAPGGLEQKIPEGKAPIGRNTMSRLERILKSRAVQRTCSGEQDRITFHDACLFWGITPRSSSIELAGSLRDLETIIEQVESAIDVGASGLRAGETQLTESTPGLLREINERLQGVFAEELRTIRERKDERKV